MRFHEEMPSLDPTMAVDGVPGLMRLRSFVDARGTLIPADADETIPFSIARYFLVRNVPADAVRAQHAQRRGHELLSCVTGACTVEVRWHTGDAVHRLADPTTALYVPPWVWVECRDFSSDAVLLVLCSHPYDPLDQITDFEEFQSGRGL